MDDKCRFRVIGFIPNTVPSVLALAIHVDEIMLSVFEWRMDQMKSMISLKNAILVSYNLNSLIIKLRLLKVIKKRKAEIIARRSNGGTILNPKQNETIEIHVKKRRSFLDLVLETHLENPKLLPLEGVQEEVGTFMGAGHHTTSAGIWSSVFGKYMFI